MDKFRMETPDLTARNIDKIAELFPNCVTEAADEQGNPKRAVNFDILRQMLSGDIVERDEAYEFTWVGKNASIVKANTPIRRTLRPCPEESVNWDTTGNLYIEGDNLEVLKLLQESYFGAVNMIYIDPPYNTGNDFLYRDNFVKSPEEYNIEQEAFDDNNDRLFKNTDTNGRFHSDWCSMIFPRLMLARNLLADNGIIMISIDDNEFECLKAICNEVFGKDNFIDNVIWKKRYGGGAKEKYLVTLHEYVLVYCKDITALDEILVPLSKESAERYYGKRDEKYELRGGYRTHPLEAVKSMDARPNLVYPIPAPDGTIIMPKRQWLWSKSRAYEALENNELEIVKGKDGNWVVSTKQYLKEADGTTRPGKMFSIIENIYTQHGTNEMISIFGNAKIFPYPKPSEFIKSLLAICDNNEKNITILDFFSGSASTAHAVMQLNAEDGGHRKFIMVNLDEPCDENSEAFKAGYQTICDIGKERIRRAGKKIREENPLTMAGLDTGFRVFKTDESNMKDVYYSSGDLTQEMIHDMESNIREDRTDLDLLFGCLLEWGLPLSMPYKSEVIDGFTIHTYVPGDAKLGIRDDLIACFEKDIPENVIREIAGRNPVRVVFRDAGFIDSPSKINVTEIFKLLAPDCRVKVI